MGARWGNMGAQWPPAGGPSGGNQTHVAAGGLTKAWEDRTVVVGAGCIRWFPSDSKLSNLQVSVCGRPCVRVRLLVLVGG